jgi:hypothetical protein
VWVVPLLLWVNPTAWGNGDAWQIAGELGLAFLGLAVVLRLPPARQPRLAPAEKKEESRSKKGCGFPSDRLSGAFKTSSGLRPTARSVDRTGCIDRSGGGQQPSAE